MKLAASDIGTGRQRASELLFVLAVALVCVPVSAPAQICNMTDVAPSFGAAPLTVHFRAAPTDCERNRDKQFWLVGGESTNSLGWSTTFYNPGDYTWEFCSWLPGCIQCCDSGTIHVSSPPCQLDCTATATVQSFDPTLPLLTVKFSANAVPHFCPAAELQYEWTFDDGRTGTNPIEFNWYNGAGPYHWSLTVRYGEATCTQHGEVALDCLKIGNLRLCADRIRRRGLPYYELSGNVNIDQSLWFTGDVIYWDRPTEGTGKLETQGSLYVKLRNRSVPLVSADFLAFEVRGDENALHPLPGNPDYYDFDLGGLRLPIFGAKPILVSPSAVRLATLATVGAPGILDLARIATEVTFTNGGDVALTRLEVVSGDLTPSISVAEVSATYDPHRNKLDVRTVCRFPFSGGTSYVGTFGFDSCGPNRIDLTLGGLFEGIPITPPHLPVKLKAGRDLVVRADHICDRYPFFIYLGTRATLCVGPGIDCVSIPGEFFRIADLGAGYQHPLNFDIRGGTPTVLGYPVAGARGKIQGNEPPYGIFVRGTANFAGFLTGALDAALSFTRMELIGSSRGTLQVPNFTCAINNHFCKITKAIFRSTFGPLPAQFADEVVDIIGRADPDAWSGTLRGKLEVSPVSIAFLVQLGPEGATLQLGTNYENLFPLLGLQRTSATAALEQTAEFVAPAKNVVFGFVATSGPPTPYLIAPSGQRITPENVGTIDGAFYATDESEGSSAFFLPAVGPGTWTLGVAPGAGEVTFQVLAAKPPPVIEFERVERVGEAVQILARVTPASTQTEAELLFSRSSGAGVFEAIPSSFDPQSGLLSATWNVAELPSDHYFITARADDGKNPPAILTWPEPLSIDRQEIAPPRQLSGWRQGSEATLSWTASASAIVGYNVLYSESGDGPGYLFSLSVPSGTAMTVSGLDPDKTYRFAVVAYDAQNRFSLPSNEIVLSPQSAACVGDCNSDNAVTIDEIIRGVNIALGSAELSTCAPFDANGDGAVTIDELVRAVNYALTGCPAPVDSTPTPTRSSGTPTGLMTATATVRASASPTATPTATTALVTRTATRTATRTHTAAPTSTLARFTPTATATPTTSGVRACTSISDSTEIPDNDPAGITSRITVDQPAIIDRVRVVLRIQHTWVGDLVVTLTRQQDATTVVLLDRPGYPADSYGCSGDNIDCEFNDSALLPAEDACSEEGPALQGSLEPAEPLAEFAGGELAGTWVLRVIDQAPGDVGQFLEWCLDADASR
jgi:subtilisin-like proprotein convertase family protein